MELWTNTDGELLRQVEYQHVGGTAEGVTFVTVTDYLSAQTGGDWPPRPDAGDPTSAQAESIDGLVRRAEEAYNSISEGDLVAPIQPAAFFQAGNEGCRWANPTEEGLTVECATGTSFELPDLRSQIYELPDKLTSEGRELLADTLPIELADAQRALRVTLGSMKLIKGAKFFREIPFFIEYASTATSAEEIAALRSGLVSNFPLKQRIVFDGYLRFLQHAGTRVNPFITSRALLVTSAARLVPVATAAHLGWSLGNVANDIGGALSPDGATSATSLQRQHSTCSAQSTRH